MVRDTKRYQYATKGVRGPDPDGPANNGRRGWFARAGWWRFLTITVETGSSKGGVYIEPTTIESLDKIITIKIRYKGKIWDRVYYITPSEPIKVFAQMITKLYVKAKSRLTGVTIDNNDITITVRKKD